MSLREKNPDPIQNLSNHSMVKMAEHDTKFPCLQKFKTIMRIVFKTIRTFRSTIFVSLKFQT